MDMEHRTYGTAIWHKMKCHACIIVCYEVFHGFTADSVSRGLLSSGTRSEAKVKNRMNEK